MKSKFLKLVLVSSLSLAVVAAHAEDKKEKKAVDTSKLPPASDKKGLTYAKDIKPIFEATCFKCHGEKKQKAELRLDSLEAALKGGENGEVIKKKDSANSKLVQAVARLDEDDAMPPEGKGEPLTKDQVGLIRAWIDQGAN